MDAEVGIGPANSLLYSKLAVNVKTLELIGTHPNQPATLV